MSWMIGWLKQLDWVAGNRDSTFMIKSLEMQTNWDAHTTIQHIPTTPLISNRSHWSWIKSEHLQGPLDREQCSLRNHSIRDLIELFHFYYLLSLLLCSWEFWWVFMDCKHPTTNEAKKIAVMEIKKNFNNCNNSPLNAAVSAAWNCVAASKKNIYHITHYFLCSNGSILKLILKRFYD